MVRVATLTLAPPPPEHDNFEPTPSELREAFSGTIAQRHGPNAPLMTSAMRARQEAALGRTKKQYDSVRIRVRFSDRTQIEQLFPHTATIDDVYALVDNALHEEGKGDYMLFQSPPKRDFPRSQSRSTLIQLGFAPAAVLSIRWSDPRRNGTCKRLIQRPMHPLHCAATSQHEPARCRLLPHFLRMHLQCPKSILMARCRTPNTRARSANSPRYGARLTQWFKSTGGK